jgi:hypothetical protein
MIAPSEDTSQCIKVTQIESVVGILKSYLISICETLSRTYEIRMRKIKEL